VIARRLAVGPAPKYRRGVTSHVAFEYLKHALTVPVLVGGIETRLVLDTGAGVNLISQALAERVGCQPDGSSYAGQRMSGQVMAVPLGTLTSLTLGDHTSSDVAVGMIDLQAFALDGAEGLLSLSYFRTVPVTISYAAGLVVLEDDASLAQRTQRGTPVPVRVEYDQCSTDLFLGIDLPSGRSITVEVDTGSEGIVLDESLASDAGVDLAAPGTRTYEGTDETGYKFTRYFAAAKGDIGVHGAGMYRVNAPDVMFQKIIYQGLVGDSFLRSFTTTYDLQNRRMVFGLPTQP
jgi:hypothetical protein